MDWRQYVTQDAKYYRPEELNHLKGDSTKLRNATGWKPSYTFETMLDEMMIHWEGLGRPLINPVIVDERKESFIEVKSINNFKSQVSAFK